MAWYQSNPMTLYKKEYTHNLGSEPIVLAYVDLSTLQESGTTGWKQIPFTYSGEMYFDPDWGTWAWDVGTVQWYSKDENTIVFVAPKNTKIVADIFIDPQYNARIS